MAKFNIVKKLDLSYLGEEWKDCYISFSAITYREVEAYTMVDREDTKAATDMAISTLQNHLVEGFGIDEKGERIAIKKEDIIELPLEIVIKAINFLTADVGKKE